MTRACDKACFNCTQGSNLKGPYVYITPANFERACKSLQGYFGTVGVFGGNPCMHPKFDELCAILRKYIPKTQCGLWSNNPLGKGAVCRKTFNPQRCNLNVHKDRKAWDEFKKTWPEARPFGLQGDSRHSPVYVSMADVYPDDEGKRWELIANCDINHHWSAMVCQVRGEARAYFCEIAGGQAMLHESDPDYPDFGLEVTPGWWKRPMQDFADQVRFHCHRCGVPMRGYGTLACDSDANGKEFVSAEHLEVYKPKRTQREVVVVDSPEQLDGKNLRFTDYLGGAKK